MTGSLGMISILRRIRNKTSMIGILRTEGVQEKGDHQGKGNYQEKEDHQGKWNYQGRIEYPQRESILKKKKIWNKINRVMNSRKK